MGSTDRTETISTFSNADLARRLIERRAVEAVIWGMSAVNTDLMLQEMLTKTSGKVNQIVYWGRPIRRSPDRKRTFVNFAERPRADISPLT
jgi:hypothetical protein